MSGTDHIGASDPMARLVVATAEAVLALAAVTDARGQAEFEVRRLRAELAADRPAALNDDQAEAELAEAVSGFARALRDERQRRRISQQEVARRLGTTQSAISDWEAGSRINAVNLVRWAAVFGYELRLVPPVGGER